MYHFLSIITLLIFVICGKMVSNTNVRTNTQYWRIMFWPILAFSITYGLRYGWLDDFLLYKNGIYDNFNYVDKGRLGWLLYGLFWISNRLLLPFNFIIFILDATIIFCYCWLIKPYKRHAYWILPFFFGSSFMCSQFIAFYPALSIFLVFASAFSLYELKNNIWHIKKNIWIILLLIAAFGFHKAIVFALPFYAIALFVRFNPKYVIPLYAISFFFIQDWWISLLSALATYIQLSDIPLLAYMSNYTDSASEFFSSDVHSINDETLPLSYYLGSFFSNSFALVLFNKFRERAHSLVSINEDGRMYNYKNYANAIDKGLIFELSSIGIILTNMTMGVEVISRFAIIFSSFCPILYAMAIDYGRRQSSAIYKLMAWFILIYNLYFYYITIFRRDISHYQYIWDIL